MKAAAARGAVPVTPEELRFMVAVEARRASAASAAAELDLTHRTIRQRFGDLRGKGVLRTGALVDLRAVLGAVEGLTLVRLDLSHPAEVEAFERAISDDANVLRADMVSGAWHYAVRTLHRDIYAARVWLRLLEERPGVRATSQRPVQTLWDAPRYAAARLAADAATPTRGRGSGRKRP